MINKTVMSRPFNKKVALIFGLFIASTTLVKAQAGDNNWAAYSFGWDTAMVGKPIKPFSMVTYDGKPLNSQNLKGKVIVLDFWSTWCGPCRMLTHELDSALKKYASRDFLMIGVNFREAVRSGDPVAYWEKNGYQFPMTLNNDNYGKAVNAGNPVVLVIDQQCIIRGKWEAWSGTRAAEVETLVWELIDHPVVSLQQIVNLNRAHEYEKALWSYETLMKIDSSQKEMLQQEKLWSLLHISDSAAKDFSKEWSAKTKDSEHALETICRYFTETKGLFPDDYAYAAKVFEELITKYPKNADNFIITDDMSRCYYWAGNRQTAITTAEKSLSLAENQNANHKTLDYLQGIIKKYKNGTY